MVNVYYSSRYFSTYSSEATIVNISRSANAVAKNPYHQLPSVLNIVPVSPVVLDYNDLVNVLMRCAGHFDLS